MGEEQQTRGSRRRFSDELKHDAVEIVRTSGKPIAEVARELGIYDSTWGTGSLCRRRHKTHLRKVSAEPIPRSLATSGILRSRSKTSSTALRRNSGLYFDGRAIPAVSFPSTLRPRNRLI